MEERLVKTWNRYERIQAWSILLLSAGLVGGIAVGLLYKSISLGGTILVLGGIGCMLLESGMKKKKKELLDKYLGDFFQTELTAVFGNRKHTPEFAFSQEKLEQLSWKRGEWESCQLEEEWESCYQNLHFSVANLQLLHLYQVKKDRSMETEKKIVFDGLCMFVKTENNDLSYWTDKLKTEKISPAFLYWKENQLFLAFDKKKADKFAQIPEGIKVEHIEDLKEAFRRSLQPVLRVLEILAPKQ